MENRIATSLEQSKKLLGLGLSPDTADMFWLVVGDSPRLHVLTEPLSNYSHWDNCPAWSLSALLNLSGDYTLQTDTIREHFMVSDNCRYMTDCYNEPLDAAFELVCWLIKNGHIKTK